MEKTAGKYYGLVFEEMTDEEFNKHDIDRLFKTAFENMYAAASEIKKYVDALMGYHDHGGKKPNRDGETLQCIKDPVAFYNTWLQVATERYTECEHGNLVYYPIVALTYRATLYVFKYLRRCYDHKSWHKMYETYRNYVVLTIYEGPAQMSHAEFSQRLYDCHENFICALEEYLNVLFTHLNAATPSTGLQSAPSVETTSHVLPRVEKKIDALAVTTDETLTTVKETAAVTQETAADVKRITTENRRRKDSKYIPIEVQNIAKEYWESAKSKRYDIPRKKAHSFTKEDAYRFYKRELALAGIKSFEHFEQALRAWTNRNHHAQEKRQ